MRRHYALVIILSGFPGPQLPLKAVLEFQTKLGSDRQLKGLKCPGRQIMRVTRSLGPKIFVCFAGLRFDSDVLKLLSRPLGIRSHGRISKLDTKAIEKSKKRADRRSTTGALQSCK